MRQSHFAVAALALLVDRRRRLAERILKHELGRHVVPLDRPVDQGIDENPEPP